MAYDFDSLPSKIDWQNGQIAADIFIEEEVYQRELKMLFSRAWLFLAHDSMIPNPGDFLNTYMVGGTRHSCPAEGRLCQGLP